jgi:outer membrane lipoprotein SlyB
MKKLIMLLTFGLFGFTMFTGEFATEAQSQTVKKKWSKRKKGAVIGGVAGAATGAIISRKKGKGALIGGAVGAAGGYLYGRHKEKKAIRRANGIRS